ncbi:MAG: hypothetical protein ACOX15_07315 [Tepidanaerobacteraceae bacterium]
MPSYVLVTEGLVGGVGSGGRGGGVGGLGGGEGGLGGGDGGLGGGEGGLSGTSTGISKTCPTKIKSGSEMLFCLTIASTVLSNLRAMEVSVSPGWTTYLINYFSSFLKSGFYYYYSIG